MYLEKSVSMRHVACVCTLVVVLIVGCGQIDGQAKVADAARHGAVQQHVARRKVAVLAHLVPGSRGNLSYSNIHTYVAFINYYFMFI